MSRKEVREVDRFEASDSSGFLYTIIVYQEFSHTSTFQGTMETSGGMSMKTADGQDVYFIDDDTFEIGAGGKRLTRTSGKK